MHPRKSLQWHIRKSRDAQQATQQDSAERGELKLPSAAYSTQMPLAKGKFGATHSHAVMHCQATWGKTVNDVVIAGEGLVHRTSQQCRAWSDKQKLHQQHSKEAAGMERRPSILVSATSEPGLLP